MTAKEWAKLHNDRPAFRLPTALTSTPAFFKASNTEEEMIIESNGYLSFVAMSPITAQRMARWLLETWPDESEDIS